MLVGLIYRLPRLRPYPVRGYCLLGQCNMHMCESGFCNAEFLQSCLIIARPRLEKKKCKLTD